MQKRQQSKHAVERTRSKHVWKSDIHTDLIWNRYQKRCQSVFTVFHIVKWWCYYPRVHQPIHIPVLKQHVVWWKPATPTRAGPFTHFAVLFCALTKQRLSKCNTFSFKERTHSEVQTSVNYNASPSEWKHVAQIFSSTPDFLSCLLQGGYWRQDGKSDLNKPKTLVNKGWCTGEEMWHVFNFDVVENVHINCLFP